MAYNPMEGFEVGQAIGKSKKSSLARSAGYMSDLTKERDKKSFGMDKVIQTMMLKQAIQPSTGVFSWNPTSGQLEQEATVPKGSIVRNTTGTEDVMAKKSAEKTVTGAGAESGKIAFIKTALKEGIPGARNILFPTGDTKSFNRTAATASTIWGGGPMPLNKDAQNLYRQLGSALSARRYMLTGQAANQQEIKEAVNQFMSQWGSDPDALAQGISQIENEFNEYLNTIDPSGLYHAQGQTSSEIDPKERLKKKLMQKGLL